MDRRRDPISQPHVPCGQHDCVVARDGDCGVVIRGGVVIHDVVLLRGGVVIGVGIRDGTSAASKTPMDPDRRLDECDLVGYEGYQGCENGGNNGHGVPNAYPNHHLAAHMDCHSDLAQADILGPACLAYLLVACCTWASCHHLDSSSFGIVGLPS